MDGSRLTLAAAYTSATTLTEYGYDKLGRLISTTAVRRFGANVDVDPVAPGVQAEATRTVFAKDGQIDYELVPTAGGDVTTDYGYDSQGRVNEVDHFVDADGNHVFNSGASVGDTLLSGSTYSYNLRLRKTG